MSNIKVDSVSITGMLISPVIKPYYHNVHGYRYKTDQTAILNEVHIYLNTNDVNQFVINR